MREKWKEYYFLPSCMYIFNLRNLQSLTDHQPNLQPKSDLFPITLPSSRSLSDPIPIVVFPISFSQRPIFPSSSQASQAFTDPQFRSRFPLHQFIASRLQPRSPRKPHYPLSRSQIWLQAVTRFFPRSKKLWSLLLNCLDLIPSQTRPIHSPLKPDSQIRFTSTAALWYPIHICSL